MNALEGRLYACARVKVHPRRRLRFQGHWQDPRDKRGVTWVDVGLPFPVAVTAQELFRGLHWVQSKDLPGYVTYVDAPGLDPVGQQTFFRSSTEEGGKA